MKTKRVKAVVAHFLAIGCLFVGYFLAFDEYKAILWCSVYAFAVIAGNLFQRWIAKSSLEPKENSKYSIGPCVGADWPVELIKEIQHNQEEGSHRMCEGTSSGRLQG
ncbi:MAG: hypothetical protein QG620_372 [Patescibacteria group bacterium]|nr:hypothetical protein [Patescibacteria group bacterium]